MNHQKRLALALGALDLVPTSFVKINNFFWLKNVKWVCRGLCEDLPPLTKVTKIAIHTQVFRILLTCSEQMGRRWSKTQSILIPELQYGTGSPIKAPLLSCSRPPATFLSLGESEILSVGPAGTIIHLPVFFLLVYDADQDMLPTSCHLLSSWISAHQGEVTLLALPAPL